MMDSEAAEIRLHKHVHNSSTRGLGHAQVSCLSKLPKSLHPPVYNYQRFSVPFKVSGWVSSHWWCHSLLANPNSQAYTICQRMGLLHCCLWNCLLYLHLLLCGGGDFGAAYPQASVLHQHLEHPGRGRHSGEDLCMLLFGGAMAGRYKSQNKWRNGETGLHKTRAGTCFALIAKWTSRVNGHMLLYQLLGENYFLRDAWEAMQSGRHSAH